MIGYLVRFMDFTAVAWLVVQRSDSPSAVGLLIFFRFSSFLLIGPLVGLIVDRYPRIRVVRISQAAMAIVMFWLATMLLGGWLELWHIYVYTFVGGLIFLFEIPARRTYMAGIVGPRNITAAMALDMISLNMAWFLGSSMGGVILSGARPAFLYLGLSAMPLLNLWVLRRLPRLRRPEYADQRESLATSFAAGFRFVRQRRALSGALLVLGLTNFSAYTFESMAPVFARDIFHAGPLLFGLLMAAQGLGALIASTGLVWWGARFRRPGLILVLSALILHLASFVFSTMTWAPAAFMVLMSLGMISMFFAVMHTSLILRQTPDKMRGRVMGLQLLMMGLFPVGSLGVGLLADAIGPARAVQFFAAGGFLALTAVALAFPELRHAVGGGRSESVAAGQTEVAVTPEGPSADVGEPVPTV